MIYSLCMIFGWRFFAVQSGSMEPNIPTYGMCLIDTHVSYDDLEIGDVVVYARPTDGTKIIHRIISIGDAGAVTRGDANMLDDGISVTAENLVGRYVGHVPYLAHLYNLVHSRYGNILILGAACILFVLERRDAERETTKHKKS